MLCDRVRALRALPEWSRGGLPPGAVWVDMVAPTDEEERVVEQALGIGIPTRAEAGGLQVSDRLAARDGALYMSALLPAGADCGHGSRSLSCAPASG